MNRLFLILYFGFVCCSAHAERKLPSFTELLPVFQASDLDDASLNFPLEIFKIENLIDPEVDIDWAMSELDRVVEGVRSLPSYSNTFDGKIDSLKKYFYLDGVWNGFSKYYYDLSSYERYWNKDKKDYPSYDTYFVYKFFKEKKGNCFSMAAGLFLVAARLGLDVALVRAPAHFFLQITDPIENLVFNFEASSGGVKKTESYVREMKISEKAIQNGLYLRPKSKGEVLLDHIGLHGGKLLAYSSRHELTSFQRSILLEVH